MENMIPILRRKKKFSQLQLARVIGVSPSYLCKIEKSIQKPSNNFIQKCALALDVNENDLFPEHITIRTISKELEKTHTPLWVERNRQGLKQIELAQKIKCSPSYLSKVENNQIEPPDYFKQACCKALNKRNRQLFPIKSYK